jgi:hypothetical protein
MSEQSIASGQEFGSRDSDPADPIVANLQQWAKLANENCDRAVALNQTLSAQLREAQDRINQLEREADELGEQLLVEARAIIQDVQSNADATINRTIREADERIARLKAEAENRLVAYRISWLRRHAEPTKSKVKPISASNASKWRRTLALPVWRPTQRSVSISCDAKTRIRSSV